MITEARLLDAHEINATLENSADLVENDFRIKKIKAKLEANISKWRKLNATFARTQLDVETTGTKLNVWVEMETLLLRSSSRKRRKGVKPRNEAALRVLHIFTVTGESLPRAELFKAGLR